MSINEEIQKPSVGELVELFILDATPIGGTVFYLTSKKNDDGNLVVWNGLTFTAVPIEAKGFEMTGKGGLPRPTLKIANVTSILSAVVIAYNDLVGAKFTRIRTLRKFLDDGESPDPDATFPIDVFYIDRKSAQNKVFIEFELAAAMDQQGIKLPRRQVLKDACTHSYRVWNPTTGSFTYTNVTCPYVGTNYYKSTGEQTLSQSEDNCGRKLSDCRLRFGQSGTLPTRAFPGVRTLR